MHIEFTKPKGNAYCRMCYDKYRYHYEGEVVIKKKSLRNQIALKIETHDANGMSKSFYCIDCAKKIKKQINRVFEELEK